MLLEAAIIVFVMPSPARDAASRGDHVPPGITANP